MKLLIHRSLSVSNFTISKHDPAIEIPFDKICSKNKATSLDEAKIKVCEEIDNQINKLLKNRDVIMNLRLLDIE